MARDIVLDVLSEARGRGLLQAANDMDRLADRTDKTNRTLAEFNTDVETARKRVHDLSLEMAHSSGDNSGLTRDLRSARRELTELEKVAKVVLPSLGDEAGRGILGTLGDLGSNLRGAVIPVALGLGALLAPMIGGAVAGAVVGGVGLGGIVGGIAAAAQDPRVKAAAAVFGTDIKREFAASGESFVEPVIESLGILGQAFRDLNLDEVFAKAAPHVTKLAEGLAGLATEAMPGINRALAQMGPVMDIMAQELPELGKAFGDMIGDIAESEGALDGLRFIFNATETLAKGFGITIAALGDAFHWMGGQTASFAGTMEDAFGWVPWVGDQFRSMNDFWEETLGMAPQVISAWEPIPGRFVETAESMAAVKEEAAGFASTAASSVAAAAGLTSSFQAAAGAANGLIAAFDVLNGATLTEREALRNAEAAVDSFQAALKESDGSLSIHTEKGRTAAAAMDNLGRQAVVAAQRILDNGGSVEKANDAYNNYIGVLRKTLSQAGFTKGEIDKLISTIAKVPTSKTISIKESGAAGARAAVDSLKAAIDRVYSKTVYITAVAGITGNRAAIPGLAVGTPSAPPGMAWVGERGPELVDFRGGERVFTNQQSMAMAGSGGGGSGIVGTLRVIHETPDGEVLREELLTLKRQSGGRALGFD